LKTVGKTTIAGFNKLNLTVDHFYRDDLLNNDKNVQECDATSVDKGYIVRQIKI